MTKSKLMLFSSFSSVYISNCTNLLYIHEDDIKWTKFS